MSVGSPNPTLREPSPPGPWVDDTRCEKCGALYDDMEGPYDWTDGVIQLRSEYAQDVGSFSEIGHGPWISRGPVLWRMRVAKLSVWYWLHSDPDHTTDPLGDPAELEHLDADEDGDVDGDDWDRLYDEGEITGYGEGLAALDDEIADEYEDVDVYTDDGELVPF